MILYNASTDYGLRNLSRNLTNTDDSTYPDSELDANINTYLHLFINDIVQSMDGWDFGGEIATTSLVADQQEYVFPSDLLKIKRIEVTYDGNNWYTAEAMDINERSGATDSRTVNQEFFKTEPFYDLHDNSLFLYPIPDQNVTGGLKIWYEKEASQLTSDSDEPDFLEAYHKGLAYGAAKDYFEKHQEVKGNLSKARTMANNMEQIRRDMKDFYSRRNQDRHYVVSPGYVNYDY